ncbi:hypothetical protein TNCT_504181 [Trichonephila clavata]|uniref:Uncharacterized protein n=1 Tax=Trichonephila clavata TaxID=2740835 RepID=A0A8X6L0E3_TRICU|nr:hypothetical protein TNCT_504181 [Trichonephila clavata]
MQPQNGVSNCKGRASVYAYQKLYLVRRTPNHTIFARLHKRLCETGSLPKACNRIRDGPLKSRKLGFVMQKTQRVTSNRPTGRFSTLYHMEDSEREADLSMSYVHSVYQLQSDDFSHGFCLFWDIFRPYLWRDLIYCFCAVHRMGDISHAMRMVRCT